MFLALLLFSLYFIDQPYTKVPIHGVFDLQLRFGPVGELLGFAHIGIWDRLGLGVSYGASNLIGAGSPEFYKQPGVQIRLLIIEEGFFYPAMLVGFDNQGYGSYDDRYEIRSKGIYAQLGRTFGNAGLEIVPSIGLNYCFEQDGGLDIFTALKTQLGSSALLFEYSPNFDDPLDQNKGYLNIGIRIIFYEEIFFEFALRDLLGNSADDQKLNRMIKLGYEQTF